MRCTLQLKPASVVARGADARGKGNQPRRVYAAGPARYAEITPPPDLASDIVCFWTMRIEQGAGIFVQHLLPDLTVDVVTLNGGPFFVMGPPTNAMQLALQPGTILAGVRLRAGVVRQLLDCSPADLLDCKRYSTHAVHRPNVLCDRKPLPRWTYRARRRCGARA